jgi:hypothetical protein
MPSQEAINLMARAAQKQLDAAIKRAEEVALLQPDPPDDFEVGAVIMWSRRFASFGQVYTYVALKTAAYPPWYVTGKANSGCQLTWDGILSLMEGRVGPVEVATEWTEVEDL